MTINIGSRDISTIQLIDDDPSVRETYRFLVEDLELAAEEITEQIKDVSSLLQKFDKHNSAVICDYNLKTRKYSDINGDVIVSGLYTSFIPVVLCTRYETHLPDAIRRRRRQIPVILQPDDLNVDTLVGAFSVCIQEFNQKFSAIRKPWRTVIRVEGGEVLSTGLIQVNAVIPEWDSSSLVSFEWEINGNVALQKVMAGIMAGEIVRVYATVNVGADGLEDLYVDEWSLGKIQ